MTQERSWPVEIEAVGPVVRVSVHARDRVLLEKKLHVHGDRSGGRAPKEALPFAGAILDETRLRAP